MKTSMHKMINTNDLIAIAAFSWRNLIVGSFAGLVFFANSSNAAQKPAQWDSVVRSAAKSAPIFWLDGNYTPNKGTELSGEVNYIHGDKVWGQLQPGFWGEENGAFRMQDSGQIARPAAFKNSTVGCSQNGSLALLFQSASRLNLSIPRPDKHTLFARGDNTKAAPFEVAVVDSVIRVATAGESGKAMYTYLCKINPATWYFLSMNWEKKDGSTQVQWKLKNLDGNAAPESGAFETKQLGDMDSFLALAGTQSKDSAPDTLFSQIIVWDVPLTDAEWRKIETSLK